MAKEEKNIVGAPAVEPAEATTEPAQRTNRQRLAERFAGKEGFNADDDEGVYGAAADALDEGDKMRERFNTMTKDNPVAQDILTGVLSGKNADGSDFSIEDYLLTENLDFIIDYLEDSETAKGKYDARKKDREAKKAEAEKWLKERAGKIAKTDAAMEAAAEKMGYKPAQVQDLMEWLYGKQTDEGFDGTGLIDKAMKFELDEKDYERLFKLKDYDLQMAGAEDKGYKRGRNERIDMFKRDQKKRSEMPTDLGTGGGAKPTSEKPANQTLAALDRMKGY